MIEKLDYSSSKSQAGHSAFILEKAGVCISSSGHFSLVHQQYEVCRARAGATKADKSNRLWSQSAEIKRVSKQILCL